jgi:hypothetical protein
MSIFDAIGDVISNEASHLTNLYKSFGDSPGKTLTQFALGAEDPLGASAWSKVLGTKFTPGANQFGGETAAQYRQSRDEGVNTGPSQTLGGIADVVAAVWGAYGASGAAGGGASAGGAAAEGGTLGAEGGAAAGGASAGSADVAGLEAADSAAVAAEGAEPALTAGGAGSAGGGAAGAAGSSSSWVDYAKGVGKALAPTIVSTLLQPKPPKTKAPTAMPDPLAQQQAQQQKILAQLARRGRASTILTNAGGGGGTLGG